jgi:DNA-binding SARP family transcriptional activator
MSPKLIISFTLFGDVRISVCGYELKQFCTTRTHKLLYFLVLNRGRFFRREYLAELFWPDRDSGQGLGSLRTELWRIRTTFGKAHKDAKSLFAETGAGIGFAPTMECLVDFEQFDAILSDNTVSDFKRLQKAASLYGGDLLAGFDEDWCVYHRELYRARYLSVLEQLIDITLAERRFRDAIDIAIRFLIYDPYAEQVHVKLMECYNATGNRAAAIRQYDTYRQRLAATFNIAPMPETIAFAERIAQQAPPGKTFESNFRVALNHTQILGALGTMRQDIARATSYFETRVAQLAGSSTKRHRASRRPRFSK